MLPRLAGFLNVKKKWSITYFDSLTRVGASAIFLMKIIRGKEKVLYDAIADNKIVIWHS